MNAEVRRIWKYEYFNRILERNRKHRGDGKCLADGIREAGGEAALITVDSVSADAWQVRKCLPWDALPWERKSWRKARWSLFVAELEGKK